MTDYNPDIEEIKRRHEFLSDVVSRDVCWLIEQVQLLRNQVNQILDWGPADAGEIVFRELNQSQVREHLLQEKADKLEEALEFYADPNTYFAISFLGDSPCGGFADDQSLPGEWDTEGIYDRPMPGKRARETLERT